MEEVKRVDGSPEAGSPTLRVKERGILFKAEMVRALLEGRKTQTRRIIKPQPPAGFRYFAGYTLDSTHAPDVGKFLWAENMGPSISKAHRVRCPYGQPGDRLWVRETWSNYWMYEDEIYDPRLRQIHYRASWDGSFADDPPWKPSLHMPRWASRITLEITRVRAERLRDISEADAKAEGLAAITKDGNLVKYGIPDRDGLPGTDNHGWPWSDWDANPRMAYRTLWAKINGIHSWDANPWVWVVEFRRIEASEAKPARSAEQEPNNLVEGGPHGGR